MCSENIEAEISSPDGRFIACLSDFGCGVFSNGFTKRVVLIDVQVGPWLLVENRRRVFTGRYSIKEKLVVAWETPRRLHIISLSSPA